MRNQNLEKLFTRYRQKGDPQALGRVFDLTAPYLLNVARHLSRNREEAEDLLQETFLAVIEGAQSWQAEKQLLPWLFGIMANMAHRARRRAYRVVDPKRLSAPEPTTPPEEFSRQEFSKAIDLALSKLADPYRQVLTLHLGEGLDPLSVAKRLARSPSTVRTQIKRGLGYLRKILPVGLTPAFVAVPASSLAGIRETVMAKAAAQHGALIGATGGSMFLSLILSKPLLTGALGIGLTTGLYFGFVSGGTNPGLQEQPEPVQVVETKKEGDPPTPALQAGINRRRLPNAAGMVKVSPHVAKLPWGKLSAFQVINKETGKPVPGAEVAWWRQDLAQAGLISMLPVSLRQQPARVHEGADPMTNREDYIDGLGVKVFADDRGIVEIPLRPTTEVIVRARHGSLIGRARDEDLWGDNAQESETKPFPILIAKPRVLAFRVLNHAGQPVAGVPLVLRTKNNDILWSGISQGKSGSGKINYQLTTWRNTFSGNTAMLEPVILGPVVGHKVNLLNPTTATVELQLPMTGSVTINLVAAGQKAWPGTVFLTLETNSNRANPFPDILKLDGSGKVVFPHIALGQTLDCIVNNRRLMGVCEQETTFTGPQAPGEMVTTNFPINWQVPRIRCQVVQPDGKPLCSAPLRVDGDVEGCLHFTDEKGWVDFNVSSFAMEPSCSARIIWWQQTQKIDQLVGPNVEIRFPRRLPREGLNLGKARLAIASTLLTGKVVDDSGSPIAGANVEVRLVAPGTGEFADGMICDELGNFTIVGKCQGELALEYGKSGYFRQSPTSIFKAGTTGVTLQLCRMGSLTLSLLLDGEINKSMISAKCIDEKTGKYTWLYASSKMTTNRLRPGTHTLRILAGNDLVREIKGIAVLPGERADDSRLQNVDLRGFFKQMTIQVQRKGNDKLGGVVFFGLDKEGRREYQAASRGGYQNGHVYTVLIRKGTEQVGVAADHCGQISLPWNPQKQMVTLATGIRLDLEITSLIGPQNGLRPVLVAMDGPKSMVRHRPQTTKTNERTYDFVLPRPGRYRLTWLVFHGVNGGCHKFEYTPEPAVIVRVTARERGQSFTASLTEVEIERAYKQSK